MSSTYRVNYSDYVADITHSPNSTRKLATTGIGHHINSATSQAKTTGSTMPHYGGGAEKCVRCLKSVYLAEKKIGGGKPYHISCFNCKNCRRKLDASALSEHKGEIYCKSCYTKHFGAHGLISGVSMSTERTIDHESRYRSSSRENLVEIPITIESRRSPSPSISPADKFSPMSMNEKTPPQTQTSAQDRSRSPSPSAFIPVTTFLPRVVEPRMVPMTMTTNLDSPPTASTQYSTIAAIAKHHHHHQEDDFDD